VDFSAPALDINHLQDLSPLPLLLLIVIVVVIVVVVVVVVVVWHLRNRIESSQSEIKSNQVNESIQVHSSPKHKTMTKKIHQLLPLLCVETLVVWFLLHRLRCLATRTVMTAPWELNLVLIRVVESASALVVIVVIVVGLPARVLRRRRLFCKWLRVEGLGSRASLATTSFRV